MARSSNVSFSGHTCSPNAQCWHPPVPGLGTLPKKLGGYSVVDHLPKRVWHETQHDLHQNGPSTKPVPQSKGVLDTRVVGSLISSHECQVIVKIQDGTPGVSL